MMRDMTKGAPLGHLFLYAVPLLLGNWLQLAYNAVDSIIAGRFIGQDGLSADDEDLLLGGAVAQGLLQ